MSWRRVYCQLIRIVSVLLLLVRRTTAGGFSACGVNRGAAFLDVDDLAFLIHNEGGAIRNPGLGDENAVLSSYFSVEEIAQQRERGVELGGKFFLRGGVVGTDAKNLGVGAFKFRNTSLVCSDFACSTTGKGGREKR